MSETTNGREVAGIGRYHAWDMERHGPDVRPEYVSNADVAFLLSEIERLRETLAFYADPDTYEQVDMLGLCALSDDFDGCERPGKRAREAIGARFDYDGSIILGVGPRCAHCDRDRLPNESVCRRHWIPNAGPA